MKKILISVIVPVYNLENYIKKCIESVMNQTYRNIEIIIIDDGSSDKTRIICQSLQSNDSRIIFASKENGGQGSARNYGLCMAKGDYISFIDGDDFIHPQMLENLLCSALENDVYVVSCNYIQSKDRSINWEKSDAKRKSGIVDSEEYILDLIKGTGKYNTSVCNKIFKKEILSSIMFPELRAFEDDYFIFKVLLSTPKVLHIDYPYYFYYWREESTMTSSFNTNKLALYRIQKMIANEFKEKNSKFYNEMLSIALSKQILCYGITLINEKCWGKDLTNKLYYEIKEDYYMIYKPEIKGFKRAFLLFLIYIPTITKIILIIYVKHKNKSSSLKSNIP